MIHFEAQNHRYTVDGVRWPSVTELIEYAGLVSVFCKKPFYAERGRFAHKAIELDIRGSLDEATVDPQVRPYLDGWRSFCRAADVEVVYHNLIVSDPVLRYAGTLDVAVRMNHRSLIWVIDVKAGAKAKWHPIQAWMYANALAREIKQPCWWGNLYLKDGRFNWKPSDTDYMEVARNISEKWWAAHGERSIDPGQKSMRDLWG